MHRHYPVEEPTEPPVQEPEDEEDEEDEDDNDDPSWGEHEQYDGTFGH